MMGPVIVDVLTTPKPEFLHHVRNSLRVMLLLQRAEDRRKAMLTSIQLLRKSLQSLLCGAITSQHVRYPAGLTPSATCLFCDGDDEDAYHVLQSCPSWQIRDDLTHLRLRPTAWPPAITLAFCPSCPLGCVLVDRPGCARSHHPGSHAAPDWQ